MKNQLFIAIITICQWGYSQQEKIDLIEYKLHLADSFYNTNQFNQAIALSREVYHFDFANLEIPKRGDIKWDYHMSFFPGNAKSNASFLLGQSYFKQARYDSSLYFLNRVLLPINFAPIRNFTYSLEMDIHLTYLKSICLEKTDQEQKALGILTRYLFLDRIQTTTQGWYTQKDLVVRYKSLQKEQIPCDVHNVVQDQKDSIAFFSWRQYQGLQPELYYRIGEEYCPILPGSEYLNLTNQLLLYPKQSDPTFPFQNIQPEINYDKVKELLPLMQYFKGN